MIIARQCQDERNFHDFGRLHAQWPDIDPALRTHGGDAEQFDHDQQEQRAQIGRIGKTHPHPRRHHGHHQHDCQTGGKNVVA